MNCLENSKQAGTELLSSKQVILTVRSMDEEKLYFPIFNKNEFTSFTIAWYQCNRKNQVVSVSLSVKSVLNISVFLTGCDNT